MKYMVFIALMTIGRVFAQNEKETSKSVASAFEENFNSGNFGAIFDTFDANMQAALPRDKTFDFLGSIKTRSGKITKREFVKYVQTFASYKTNFERGLLSVNISIDDNSKINGLYVEAFKEGNLPKIDRNTTKLRLPFADEWTVVWGGDTKELNYHVENKAQKNAFDFVVEGPNGRSYKTDGKTNEDYYAFGKELVAPCEGEVVLVVDGIKDNTPGETNPIYVPGNTVIIKTPRNEYLFLAHFKQHSIAVKQGQFLKRGQLVGLCGNSGNSTEAHLHFHVQNVENMVVATGVKCFFDSLRVNGQIKNDYSPLKNEKVRSE